MFNLFDDSGYLWNSFVYLDKNDEPDPEKNSLKAGLASWVLLLFHIKELLGYSYNLYVDDWYTMQSLFECLYKHDTVAAGTARQTESTCQNHLKIS